MLMKSSGFREETNWENQQSIRHKMYNNVAYLVEKVKTSTLDHYGDATFTESYKSVFCNVLSIGTNEFYQAQTSGVKPEIKISIADYYDYNGQEEVVLDEIRYKVLRTYRSLGSNVLEITLYGGVRNECSEISS